MLESARHAGISADRAPTALAVSRQVLVTVATSSMMARAPGSVSPKNCEADSNRSSEQVPSPRSMFVVSTRALTIGFSSRMVAARARESMGARVSNIGKLLNVSAGCEWARMLRKSCVAGRAAAFGPRRERSGVGIRMHGLVRLCFGLSLHPRTHLRPTAQ